MILLSKILAGKWRVRSDFIEIMFLLAMGLLITALLVFILVNIYNILKFPLSMLCKIKHRPAEITHTVSKNRFGHTHRVDLVGVRFLDTKRKTKRTFWMNCGGFREGDQGTFYYRGVMGIHFEKTDSALKDTYDYHQKFNFARKKHMDAEQKTKKEKQRPKRKYW